MLGIIADWSGGKEGQVPILGNIPVEGVKRIDKYKE